MGRHAARRPAAVGLNRARVRTTPGERASALRALVRTRGARASEPHPNETTRGGRRGSSLSGRDQLLLHSAISFSVGAVSIRSALFFAASIAFFAVATASDFFPALACQRASRLRLK